MNLDQLQQEVQRWAMRNFPDATSMEPLMGLVEESGELAEPLAGDPRISGLTILLGRLHHAFLKRYQRIFSTKDMAATLPLLASSLAKALKTSVPSSRADL